MHPVHDLTLYEEFISKKLICLLYMSEHKFFSYIGAAYVPVSVLFLFYDINGKSVFTGSIPKKFRCSLPSFSESEIVAYNYRLCIELSHKDLIHKILGLHISQLLGKRTFNHNIYAEVLCKIPLFVICHDDAVFTYSDHRLRRNVKSKQSSLQSS